MTREYAAAHVTEADSTRPEHHVIFLRVVDCGAPKCADRAGQWMRCPACKTIVARCGQHSRNLPEQTKEHCRG